MANTVTEAWYRSRIEWNPLQLYNLSYYYAAFYLYIFSSAMAKGQEVNNAS